MKNTSKSHPFLLLLLPALALILLASCRKDPVKTIVQGHITEYGSGEPLPGARIYLWCYNGEIFGPSGSSFVDSLVPDAQGYFHAEYNDRDLCGGIYLSAYKKGYFYKEDIDIHSGVNDLEIVLIPQAWIKVRCIADEGQSSLEFQVDNYSQSISKYLSQDTIFRYLGGYSPLWGNSKEEISWRTYPNNAYYQDTVFLRGLDTTLYTIHY